MTDTLTGAPPLPIPANWVCGRNDPDLIEDGEGPLAIHMTFPDTPANRDLLRDWLRWLMDNDPAWNGIKEYKAP